MSLSQLPPDFVETRNALHQVAFFAMAPARYKAMGRMGLEPKTGGFGTPEFGGQVARVDSDQLVHSKDGNVATQTITTVRAAAEFLGIGYEVEWFSDFHDPLGPADPDTPLEVDRDASLALGDWFKFGFDVLNQLRKHGDEDDDVTEVQLWPEHFDPATELGDPDKDRRASFGASPGDEANPQPYLFVAAWSEVDRSKSFWSDESFNGASLGYSELISSADPMERGLDFLLEGYRVLHSG